MSSKRASLSNNEWYVMEYLWDNAPLTLMQIVHSLAEERGWSPSTIKTMVSRMEAKKVIQGKREGRTKYFYPAVERQEAVLRETDQLLQKAFSDNVGLLMSALVEHKQLSRAEIEELKKILDDAETAGD